jgi:hypothetical protein
VFELGSELASIHSSGFQQFSGTSIFIPQSICFIGFTAFAHSKFVASVHFDANSSLIQMRVHLSDAIRKVLMVVLSFSDYNSVFSETHP